MIEVIFHHLWQQFVGRQNMQLRMFFSFRIRNMFLDKMVLRKRIWRLSFGWERFISNKIYPNFSSGMQLLDNSLSFSDYDDDLMNLIMADYDICCGRHCCTGPDCFPKKWFNHYLCMFVTIKKCHIFQYTENI